MDSRLGSLGDFVAFVRAAKDRGMRVIVDLVVNHTSDRHPWSWPARSSERSLHRDYYVWRDEPAGEPSGVVFPDAEDSLWTWDEKAGQWYLHHFYPTTRSQHRPRGGGRGDRPDRRLLARARGRRVPRDAVPFLIELGGIEGDVDLDPHDFLKDLGSCRAARATRCCSAR